MEFVSQGEEVAVADAGGLALFWVQKDLALRSAQDCASTPQLSRRSFLWHQPRTKRFKTLLKEQQIPIYGWDRVVDTAVDRSKLFLLDHALSFRRQQPGFSETFDRQSLQARCLQGPTTTQHEASQSPAVPFIHFSAVQIHLDGSIESQNTTAVQPSRLSTCTLKAAEYERGGETDQAGGLRLKIEHIMGIAPDPSSMRHALNIRVNSTQLENEVEDKMKTWKSDEGHHSRCEREQGERGTGDDEADLKG